MRTFSAWSAVCVAAAVLGGCKELGFEEGPIPVGPPAEVTAPVPEPGVITLEVEAFKLDEAKVVDLAGASGGKAVLFDSETAGAETSVNLKKGTYEVMAFAQGADADHDAFYLSVAGIEERLFHDEAYGQVGPTSTFTVSIPTDGAHKVVLMAAETGVHIDRVVLKPAK